MVTLGSESSGMTRSIPVVLAAYNDEMITAIAGPLLHYLRSGDEVDLVSGNDGHALSIVTLNRWSARLAAVLPNGVALSAHTSGLEKVREVAAQTTRAIESVLLDYEPDFDPLFSWDFPSTLAHLDRFAELCRGNGRRAIGYPTGRAIQEPDLLRFGWDYGEMALHVDALYPQTQHWASHAQSDWFSAISRLLDQHSRKGLDPRHLTVQLTIGQGGNGIPAEIAVERWREAVDLGIGRVFLWWSPAFATEMQRFLTSIDI
jgi:hypothetical protein